MACPIILTRYLYFLDEVRYSLQESILDGKSFNECVFWCGELYYSGYKKLLWEFVFEFYYNFCAITHPRYEKKLAKIHADFQKKNCISKILAAITLLFYTKKNYEVFTIWCIQPDIPNKIYIGRNPKWYSALDILPKYKNFIRSLHAKNWHNVVFYIHHLDSDLLYDSVKKYFIGVHDHKLKDKQLSDIPYANKKHIILALILYLFIDESKIQKRNIFRAYDHSKYAQELEESNIVVTPAYKTLGEKLQYQINSNIGCFPLNRYKKDVNIQHIYWYNWEYYSYQCPLWKKRFDQCKIKVDDDRKKIIFEDDDEYESFCEKYYYESDEQSKAIQEKNTGPIPKTSLESWLSNKLN